MGLLMNIQKTVLGLFLLLSAGCATVTANPEDWTIERAKAMIKKAEVRKFQWARIDKSEITEADLGCGDDHFIHFYYEDAQVKGEEQIVRFTIKKIRFADIAEVRVESSWNILWSWPMTGALTGPCLRGYRVPGAGDADRLGAGGVLVG